VTLIKSVLQPHLTYASVALGYPAKSHLKKLQAVENIALRTAVDVPWYDRNVTIERVLQFTTATERIKQSAVKISQKAESSENQLLRESVNYDPELEAPHKRLRYQLLDNG